VVQLLLQDFVPQPLALPARIVGILEGEVRQRVWLSTTASGVQAGQFADEHLQRPAIGDDMVQGQQQEVLVLLQAQQPDAPERSLAQFKGTRSLLAGQLPGKRAARLVLQPSQVEHGQWNRTRRADVLKRRALLADYTGAQALVPLHQDVQTLL